MTKPISMAGENAGLKEAADIIRDVAKEITAAMPSKKIPPTIISFVRGGVAYVNAGGPGGKTAPNAYMFETIGARHPLFGDKRHWYDQPYRPFLEDAAEIAGQAAANAYADIAISTWARESGYR